MITIQDKSLLSPIVVLLFAVICQFIVCHISFYHTFNPKYGMKVCSKLTRL